MKTRFFWNAWKTRARHLKTEVRALGLACRDPRVGWSTRLLALCVVVYALSPIDLIPDFIPILGLLDDLILLPLGIALVLKTIPPEVMCECRERAVSIESDARLATIGGVSVVAIWLLTLCVLLRHFL